MDMPVEHLPGVARAKAAAGHDAPEVLDKLKDPVCGIAAPATSAHTVAPTGAPTPACHARRQPTLPASPAA